MIEKQGRRKGIDFCGTCNCNFEPEHWYSAIWAMIARHCI